MESIRQLYKIGYGPSSSHTMGPRNAAGMFLKRNAGAVRFEVVLYGALAATGKGHLTDKAILDVLSPAAPTEIEWQLDVFLPFHPNGMRFKAYSADGSVMDDVTLYSIGGGDVIRDGEERKTSESVYSMTTIAEILNWCDTTGHSFWEYVEQCEDSSVWDYLSEVWKVMKEAVERGIEAEGVLPGGLGVSRKAISYYVHSAGYNNSLKSRGLLYAYALAVSEENAAGGKIVTAPTCGSCGIVPAVLYHLHNSKNFSEKRILRALATAGLFGNVVKHNASVSGAEVGCQGEVGVACAMAAAAASQLFGGTPRQIEYSAEMGLLAIRCADLCRSLASSAMPMLPPALWMPTFIRLFQTEGIR